ncbi:MAG TPA: hypothetical protein PK402_06850 [Tepidisphaeraceae bacterium]|nr:hypothetical protein [Tepidisphaeraceae bacterium]
MIQLAFRRPLRAVEVATGGLLTLSAFYSIGIVRELQTRYWTSFWLEASRLTIPLAFITFFALAELAFKGRWKNLCRLIIAFTAISIITGAVQIVSCTHGSFLVFCGNWCLFEFDGNFCGNQRFYIPWWHDRWFN